MALIGLYDTSLNGIVMCLYGITSVEEAKQQQQTEAEAKQLSKAERKKLGT